MTVLNHQISLYAVHSSLRVVLLSLYAVHSSCVVVWTLNAVLYRHYTCCFCHYTWCFLSLYVVLFVIIRGAFVIIWGVFVITCAGGLNVIRGAFVIIRDVLNIRVLSSLYAVIWTLYAVLSSYGEYIFPTPLWTAVFVTKYTLKF